MAKQIPYKIVGNSTRQVTPLSGQQFPNATPLGQGQVPDETPSYFRPRQWRKILLPLATAQTTDLLKTFTGAVFWYVASTNSTDLLQVFFNQDTDSIPVSPGMYVIGFPFSQLRFQWAAQAGATATIMITDVYPDEDFRVQT